ncbi:hypothetical protein ANO14919_082740 [Xylariales sp. No.14919]|nr:hypothetical protein ANO14919_082740 [Xylariales sp. No.14919]
MGSPAKTADSSSMYATQGSVNLDNSHRDQNYSRTRNCCLHAERRQTDDVPSRGPNLRTIVSPSEPLSGRRNRSELRYSYRSPHHEAMNSDEIPSRLRLPLWLAAAAMSFSSSLLVGAMLSSLSPCTGKGPGRSWSESQPLLREEQALVCSAALFDPPVR